MLTSDIKNGYSLETKFTPKTESVECASLCHLGHISDPLMVPKAHLESMFPKDKKLYSCTTDNKSHDCSLGRKSLSYPCFRTLAVTRGLFIGCI